MSQTENMRPLPALRIHTNIPSPYRKHQFEMIASRFPDAMFYFYTEMDSDRPWCDDLESWRVRYRRMRRTVSLGRLGKLSTDLLRELIRQPRATVHLVGAGLSMLDWCLLCVLGFLRLATVVHFNDAGFPDQVPPRMRARWRNVLIHGCWRMFTPGRLGRAYGASLGFKEADIYNSFFSHDVGLFDTFFRENQERARSQLRKEQWIPDDHNVILTISRCLDWKRLEDAAEALVLLEQKSPEISRRVTYVLIGEGEWKAHVSILKRLKTIRVIFISQMPYEQVLPWYCASDLLLFPSEGDIWGLVVNEALSMRVPVVCTDRIGASELVRDGINGFKVPVRAPEMICERLVKCMSDEPQLAVLKTRAGEITTAWRTEYGVQELVRLCHGVRVK